MPSFREVNRPLKVGELPDERKGREQEDGGHNDPSKSLHAVILAAAGVQWTIGSMKIKSTTELSTPMVSRTAQKTRPTKFGQ